VSRKDRTRPATSKDGDIALKKAQQFMDAAKAEYLNERWDSAGLNAIHSGISAADAVVIHASGLRSASQDHSAVVSLLEKGVSGFRGSPRTQLIGLLKMKNVVAYEQRLITKSEAHRLVSAAERFLAWAQTKSN